jgi:hypothetical protein
MVVDRRQIDVSAGGNHAHRRPFIAMRHEQPLGHIEDAFASIVIGLLVGHEIAGP